MEGTSSASREAAASRRRTEDRAESVEDTALRSMVEVEFTVLESAMSYRFVYWIGLVWSRCRWECEGRGHEPVEKYEVMAREERCALG